MKLFGHVQLRCDFCNKLFRASSTHHRSCRTCRHAHELARIAFLPFAMSI